MNLLRAVLMLMALGLGSLLDAPVQPKPPQLGPNLPAHAATHRIHMINALEGAGCSATAIGPHALLTAAHCDLGTNKVVIDDLSVTATISSKGYDGNDHMILLLSDYTFTSIAQIDQRAPRTQEHVLLWGNPGRSRDVFREGYLKSKSEFPGADDQTRTLYVFQLGCYPGDSGGAIFSDEGKILTVVSMGDQSAETAVFALQFTPVQLLLASK
jgi:hypothetical protein